MTAWLRFGGIRRGLATARPRRILEIGAGEGALGVWLARDVEYVGVEPDDASRGVALARLDGLGRGTMVRSLADTDAQRFDAVCAFEVLEHIGDDRGALRSWREKLEPGGYLLLSVPAHSSRFGLSDRYVGHFRRYDRRVLQDLLASEGFQILHWQSYGAGLGYFIEVMRNALLSRRSSTTSPAEGTAISGRLFQPRSQRRVLLNYLIAMPFRAVQAPFASTDVGIGYVVLARRHGEEE